jgi:anthranilate synthase component 2
MMNTYINICIIDNFDSFTFNLLEEFSKPNIKLHVWRNSMTVEEIERRLEEIEGAKLLVFSPGPGHPDQAGSMNALIERMKGRLPMFGVCLGMQAMVGVFGGKVQPILSVVHGKARILEHDQSLIFKGLKNRIAIGRYHSLAALHVPDSMRVFGLCEDVVMAISHKTYPIIGIQFHPESILTTSGSTMIANVIDWARDFYAKKHS